MSIVINSLTPTNPLVSSGNSVTFVVDAVDTNGASLSYIWQFSTDGNVYSSSGLVNNTDATYTTSNLTINQSGLYFRVGVSDGVSTVYSNLYPGIGDRIVTVVQDPSIVTQINPLVDYYPTTQIVNVGDDFIFTASASLANSDISYSDTVTNIDFQWQYSENGGVDWINLNSGGSITITDTIDSLEDSTFYKYSTLLYNNVLFDANLFQYRVVVSFPGAVNDPVTLPPIQLIVSPQINIYRQPGEGNDTIQQQSYKTSIVESGKLKFQVGALSTANTELSYFWEFSTDNLNWLPVDNLINLYNCILKPGTSSNSDVIELERFIYYDIVGVRCRISGVSNETSVISDVHYFYMTDIETLPIINDNSSTIDVVEDRYGDVANRSEFIFDPVQDFTILSLLDINPNTGINGSLLLQYERQDYGDTIWSSIGDPIEFTPPENFYEYTEFPTLTPIHITASYTSFPLRKSVDDLSKYRLKISASSRYTLTGNVKTEIPYYSSEVTLNVYRTVYITSQPASSSIFPNQSISFSVAAQPSSGDSSDITYQWQYNTSNTPLGWQNVPSTSKYVGSNSDILIVNDVSVSETYRYFRCIVNISGQLSSKTSEVSEIIIRRDFFTQFSTLNDIYAREFDNASFTITATSVSNSAVSYQWQKSSNDVSWVDLSGETSNVLNLFSLSPSDAGFYRVKLTSFGGEVIYSNSASLEVAELSIAITRNIPSSITVIEGDESPYTFDCLGISSLGNIVNYQWEIKRSGSSTFENIGNGLNNFPDDSSIYIPNAFNKDVDNQCIIRCKLTDDEIPEVFYTTECLVTVKRRFIYFASPSPITLKEGSNFILDLNHSTTGGTATFSWQKSTNGGSSWSDIGETSDRVIFPSISSSDNNTSYRCQVTLPLCDEYFYSKNGNVFITSATGFTEVVTLVVSEAVAKPTYYSLESQKTGAAIGTVICVPKPPDFSTSGSTNADDISRWKVSVSGALNSGGNTSSVSTSGSEYSANKPSWASSSYTSPKWVLSEDRFKGYIEMRGQYLKAKDFPELARMFGTTFGGSISNQYPLYDDGDIFRMPLLYGKRLMGTGNVDNNRGSVSINPIYDRNGESGGDKNVPGSIGGRYNWGILSQLPPGSPGVGGGDGQAGIDPNPATFSLGSFTTTGISEVNAFVQPTFTGTVSYSISNAGPSPVTTPIHNHRAVVAAWEEKQASAGCGDMPPLIEQDYFVETLPAGGTLEPAPTISSGALHTHSGFGNVGSFSMTLDGGMSISDTTLRLSGQSQQLFNNSLRFYLRNAEDIPVNSAYFRLKYMIKAY